MYTSLLCIHFPLANPDSFLFISALKHCTNEQKPADSQEAIKIMKELSGLTLDVDELKESKAAETISCLRKHESSTIAAEAKKLRLKWVEVSVHRLI